MANGWSQRQLAERAGVSQQLIWKMEAGKSRQPRYVTKIAGVLDLSAAWLMYGVTELDELDDDAIELALAAMKMSEEERRALREYVTQTTKRASNDR